MDVLANLIDAACDQRGCAINNNGDKGDSQDNYYDTPDPRIHIASLKSDKVLLTISSVSGAWTAPR